MSGLRKDIQAIIQFCRRGIAPSLSICLPALSFQICLCFTGWLIYSPAPKNLAGSASKPQSRNYFTNHL